MLGLAALRLAARLAERVVVVDYGAGNLRSAAKALEAAGGDVSVSGDPAVVASAARIVLPGVGAFAQCIGALRERSGLELALREAVLTRGVPFLGVCVGMQLLADAGHEHGSHAGLGWLPGSVTRLTPGDPTLKIPHMGWNEIVETAPHAVLPSLAGVGYFVHSYRFDVLDTAHCLATTDHGGGFASVVGRDNILGVQFHPEKSQAYGLGLLAGFLKWCP